MFTGKITKRLDAIEPKVKHIYSEMSVNGDMLHNLNTSFQKFFQTLGYESQRLESGEVVFVKTKSKKQGRK